MPTLEARMIAIAQNRLLYRSGIVIIYSRCEEGRGRKQTNTSSSVTEPDTLDSENLYLASGMPYCHSGFIRAGKPRYRRSKEILRFLQPVMAGFRRKQ